MPVKLIAIIPGDVFKIDTVRLELLNTLRRSGTRIKRDFRKTTATWKRKPKFETKVSLRRAAAEGGVAVTTNDEIFGYVDAGTKPHPIVARRARVLRFNSRFAPKTRPGFVGSFRGDSSGPLVFRRSVMHPGTRARRFSEAIAQLALQWFPGEIQAAINKGVAKSGGTK